MCMLSEWLVERTREETTKKVTQQVQLEDHIEFVRNLMDSMNLSVHQAMDALEIPEAERKNVLDALAIS